MRRKILTTADLHLTSKQGEEYRHRTLRSMMDIIVAENADAFVILGDLTEEKDRHGSVLVNLIVNHLHLFAQAVPTYVMMGNHDYHNEGHPFFEFIKRIPNLHWIDKVSDGASIAPYFDDIVFLPHTRKWESDWQNVKWEKFDFAFAHNTFMNAKSAQDHKLEGIPLHAIPKHVEVIAGDVHVPQSFSGITYIGAPYSVDFGDTYKPRVAVLDDNKLKFISMAKHPQKVMLEMNSVESLHDMSLKGSLIAGDVVKVRVGIDNMGEWHQVHKDVRKWITDMGAVPAKIEPVVAQQRAKKRFDIRAAGTSVQSERDILRDFAKRHDVQPYDLDEGMDIIDHGDEVIAGLKK